MINPEADFLYFGSFMIKEYVGKKLAPERIENKMYFVTEFVTVTGQMDFASFDFRIRFSFVFFDAFDHKVE